MKNRLFQLWKLRSVIHLTAGLIIFCGVSGGFPTEATEQRWQPLETLQQYSHDRQAYQAIQLNNGMKVLLVTDPQAPRSMTAVGLPVGSLPVDSMPDKPELVWTAPGGRVWLMPSRYFHREFKSNISLVLRNPPAMQGIRNHVLGMLFTELVNADLQEFYFQAHKAGIFISRGPRHYEEEGKGLAIHEAGLVTNVGGSYQNLLLLKKLVSHCQQMVFTESQLKELKCRELERHDMSRPYFGGCCSLASIQAKRPIDGLWDLGYATWEQISSQITTVTLQDIEAYRKQFFEQATLDILAVGNLNKAQLRQFAQTLHKQLAIRQQKHASSKITIHQTEKALLNQTLTVDGQALCALYIPSGYDRLSSEANARLISSLPGPGFGVKSIKHSRLTGGSAGLWYLDSSGSSPEALYSRHQKVCQQLWQQLQMLKEERKFSACQQRLLKNLCSRYLEPDSFYEEASAWYDDWLNEQFSFDFHVQLIDRIKALTADDVLRFYQQAVLEPTGLALLSQIRGKVEKQSDANRANFVAPGGWKLYPSVQALQQQFMKPPAAD